MKFKFTWAHGIILAMACFIIFICTMVFSIEFSKNSFDLVSDSYYEEEINYQEEINAVKNAAELKDKPQIQISNLGIKIIFPEEFTVQNTKGKFKLIRPNSKELDINKNSLELTSENAIFIPSNVLVKGNYTLKLYWDKDKKNYQMEIPIVWN